MKLNPKQFYNGYRHNLEGQKKICTDKWVTHFWEVKNREEKESDISKKKKINY
tara:strand:+ start:327 stop:485 length:159 start_codon:yes stop_codon:yes gene_type:complete